MSLGLDDAAEAPAIRRAYRRLALQHHPDRNGGSEESSQLFMRLVAAYKELMRQERERLKVQERPRTVTAGEMAIAMGWSPTRECVAPSKRQDRIAQSPDSELSAAQSRPSSKPTTVLLGAYDIVVDLVWFLFVLGLVLGLVGIFVCPFLAMWAGSAEPDEHMSHDEIVAAREVLDARVSTIWTFIGQPISCLLALVAGACVLMVFAWFVGCLTEPLERWGRRQSKR